MWERIKRFFTTLLGSTPVLIPAPPIVPATEEPSPSTALVVLLTLINGARVAHGRTTLTVSHRLMHAAGSAARIMAITERQSHTIDGMTLLERLHGAGIPVRPSVLIGEAIGAGYADPEALMDAQTGWLNSPPHCVILLHPAYIEMGVGIAVDDHGTIYWCADFIGTVSAREEPQQLSGPLNPGASLT